MANAFGAQEREDICPVPLDQLGRLYRADPDAILTMIGAMSEDARIKLAVFCYSRAHLRDVGLSAAALCDEARLAEMAGMIGQVLAVQCRAKVRSFGGGAEEKAVPKMKISLGGGGRSLS